MLVTLLSFPKLFYLLFGIFNYCATGGTSCILKELQGIAALALALNKQHLSALVALLGTDKGLPATERTSCDEWPAATGAEGVAAHNYFKAYGALKSKRPAASAF